MSRGWFLLLVAAAWLGWPMPVAAQGGGVGEDSVPQKLDENLAAHGLSLDAYMLQEGLRTFSGGADHGWGRSRMLGVALGLDLDTSLGLEGGSAFVEWYGVGGKTVSSFAGDLQAASNIQERRRNLLAELWYQQRFLDDTWRLRLGKTDANGEFAYVESAAEFLHSSAGFSPTVFPLPTFPDPTFSVNAEWSPPLGSVKVGVYDGATSKGKTTGNHGFGAYDGDLFLVAQIGTTWEAGGGGRAALGGWRHTGTFSRFDGGVELSNEPGAGFRDSLELALELYWRIDVDEHMAITPDGQFIRHPGGMGQNDAWIAGCRFEWRL
ncbi:MAG: carbohydrate-selective porin OprB [Pseudohongiellaceae bacterium]